MTDRTLFTILASCVLFSLCGCEPTKVVPKDRPPIPAPEEGPVGMGPGSAVAPNDLPPDAEPPMDASESTPASPEVDSPASGKVERQPEISIPATKDSPPAKGKEY